MSSLDFYQSLPLVQTFIFLSDYASYVNFMFMYSKIHPFPSFLLTSCVMCSSPEIKGQSHSVLQLCHITVLTWE